MKNATQPVVITDKNGRITTVHRKVEQSSSQGAFPAPVPPSISPSRSALESRWKELSDWHNWYKELPEKLSKAVGELSDDELGDLIGIVEADIPNNGEIILSVTEGIMDRHGEKRSRWLRRMNHNHRRRWDEYCAEVKEYQGSNYVRPDSKSVTRFTMMAADGVESYSGRGFDLTLDQEADLISLTSSIYTQSIFKQFDEEMLDIDEDDLGREANIRIASDDLVRCVVDYPERLETIRGHIKDPKVKRAVEVLELLRGEGSSSLTSGAL